MREFLSRLFPYLATYFNIPHLAEFPYLIPLGVVFIAMVIFMRRACSVSPSGG